MHTHILARLFHKLALPSIGMRRIGRNAPEYVQAVDLKDFFTALNVINLSSGQQRRGFGASQRRFFTKLSTEIVHRQHDWRHLDCQTHTPCRTQPQRMHKTMRICTPVQCLTLEGTHENDGFKRWICRQGKAQTAAMAKLS
ncbi:hypothetical protein [Ottowia sp.]|uniref:hypothetical protein n=1 Tax=Ottowia sp. TaxID=1898956 RepID=UPI003A8A0CA5